ncbi:unnamed protein product [Brachionus calyciflorus]|uniref:Uncharacterized protein n=1 Tax=Brachionus calyciflorus TaxID=104777 RepID=A0A813XPE3_9BILA|nr:unnamed protein product [Brachionus calyciflorus]
MIETLNDTFFVQNVNFATFLKANGTKGNILDYIITDSSDRISFIEPRAPLGNINQGHIMMKWTYKIEELQSKNHRISSFNYRKADYISMNSVFESTNWGLKFRDLDVNQMYENFLGEYHKVVEKYVPVKINTIGRVKPNWLNRDIKKLIDKKNKSWLKCRKTKFSNRKMVKQYDETKKLCFKEIKKAVRRYERNLAKHCKSNPKSIYAYMNKKSKVRDSITALKINDKIVTDRLEIAKSFNLYFKSVFTRQEIGDPPAFSLRTDKIFKINPFKSV